eukprot:TRINITY_DN392_c0_g1_i3.p1 TRINITY_DN392_c0_g1~~TRINITY_DN392_c0_g1_i3.p1  ORF type:complete len:292 (-),score=42.71 TRINITY_DN392_c0_g1_i3:116-991(-)
MKDKRDFCDCFYLRSAKARSPRRRAMVHLQMHEIIATAYSILQQNPPTWKSAILSNVLILTAGSPLLFLGLTMPGIAAALFLGSVSWRAFGSHGFLIVVCYYLIGTMATKLKIKQKEREGIAEKRKGRRGPNSVFGSGAAGLICALASIYDMGGPEFKNVWLIGFVASYCTKLSDTVSSEIGKAYGKKTYLITNFKLVPRGTEGAVSLEGTLAGLIASILLATAASFMGQIAGLGAAICVISSQLANILESQIGALFQDKEGFEWLTNDIANVINILSGASLAMVIGQFFS